MPPEANVYRYTTSLLETHKPSTILFECAASPAAAPAAQASALSIAETPESLLL
jgi:hypothetical protein